MLGPPLDQWLTYDRANHFDRWSFLDIHFGFFIFNHFYKWQFLRIQLHKINGPFFLDWLLFFGALLLHPTRGANIEIRPEKTIKQNRDKIWIRHKNQRFFSLPHLQTDYELFHVSMIGCIQLVSFRKQQCSTNAPGSHKNLQALQEDEIQPRSCSKQLLQPRLQYP